MLIADAARAGLGALFLGGAIGAICGIVKEQRRVERQRQMRLRMPSVIAGMRAFTLPLEKLAATPKADIATLEKLARRCATMVQSNMSILRVDPSVVTLGMLTEMSSTQEAIHRMLRQFYATSAVPMLTHNSAQVPVSTELRAAAASLLDTVAAVKHQFDLEVRNKYNEAIARRGMALPSAHLVN